jgi:hypothetical protein
MSEFDELRELMERAAANAPDQIGRTNAVKARGRRVRRQRRIIGAVAAVVVIGGGAAIALPLLPATPNASQRVMVVTTPTDQPIPTPIPAGSPMPSASALPTPTPSASLSAAPGGSPNPQPTEALSYSVETHLAPATGNGYAMTAVDIHVTGWLSGRVIVTSLNIDPNQSMGYLDSPRESCTRDATIRSIDRTFTFTYAFREATSYPIRFSLLSGTCRTTRTNHDWRTTIDVADGNSQTNGPVQPYFIEPFGNATVNGSQIAIDPAMLDDDGNISQLSIDWGNGGPPTVITGMQTCHDPAPSGKYWPYTAIGQRAVSPILSRGTYTVTITETSTGCDGTDPQTASTSHTFTVTG